MNMVQNDQSCPMNQCTFESKILKDTVQEQNISVQINITILSFHTIYFNTFNPGLFSTKRHQIPGFLRLK